MGDEEESGAFTLEFSASELDSLRTILNYSQVALDDPSYRMAAESLGMKVEEEINSEEFAEQMEKEIEEYKEKAESEGLGMNQLMNNAPQKDTRSLH